jgi:hypothetical protein
MEDLHRCLVTRVSASAGARAALHELKNGRSLHGLGPCYSLAGMRRLLALTREKSLEQHSVSCAVGLLQGELVLSVCAGQTRGGDSSRKRGRDEPAAAAPKRARSWLPGMAWLGRGGGVQAAPAPEAQPAADTRAAALESEARAAFERLLPEHAPSDTALAALGSLARAMLGARATGAPDVDLFESVGVEFNAPDVGTRSNPLLLGALERVGTESRATRVLLAAKLAEGASLNVAQLEHWLQRANLTEPSGALYREPAADADGRAHALLLVCFG